MKKHIKTSLFLAALLSVPLLCFPDAILAYAQYRLGAYYAQADAKESLKWFRLAAERGSAKAQCYLGNAYCNGEGVVQDVEEAMRWFRKAAEKGNSESQCQLGWFLSVHADLHDAKDRSVEEAAMWYRLAAEQGAAYGARQLGDFYAYGIGVRQDARESVRWYQLAAESKQSEWDLSDSQAYAQRALGKAYAEGKGVVQDEKTAYAWLVLAAAGGWGESELKTSLKARLTKEEIEAAHSWARKRFEAQAGTK